MKELRAERALRVLFAFDPRRTAILLIGGDKSPRTRDEPSESEVDGGRSGEAPEEDRLKPVEDQTNDEGPGR